MSGEEEVGGYYAELKLLTDAASFAQGRKQLEDFTKAGERAISVFSALQRITGGGGSAGGGGGARWVGGGPGEFAQGQIAYNGAMASYGGIPSRHYRRTGGQGWRWVGGGPGGFAQDQIAYNGAMASYGGIPSEPNGGGNYQGAGGQGWRYAGNNFGQSGGGGRLPPDSGYLRDRGDGEGGEDKNEAKKGAITRLATLYALVKAVQMLERFTKAMWDLTGTTTKAIQTMSASSVMAGMSRYDFTGWTTAISATAGKEYVAPFTSAATQIENASRGLYTGHSDDYKTLAGNEAMLGLDPKELMNMNNNERMNKIITALLVHIKANSKQGMSLANNLGLGDVMAGLTAPGVDIGSADQLLSHADYSAVPTKNQVGEAQNFSKLQMLLDNMSKLLGNTALDSINDTVVGLNNWLTDPDNQTKIEGAFKAIGTIFNFILKATAGIGENAITQLDRLNTVMESPGGLGAQFLKGLNPLYDPDKDPMFDPRFKHKAYVEADKQISIILKYQNSSPEAKAELSREMTKAVRWATTASAAAAAAAAAAATDTSGRPLVRPLAGAAVPVRR